MNKRVLVVAAHPDDEILGCGGTVIQHVENKDDVHVMIMAEGLTSRDSKRNVIVKNKELNALHKNSILAAEIMGVSDLQICNFPDNRMDRIDLLDVVKKIEEKIALYRPDIIYTHHAGDVNIDHMITHNAVVTASRSLPGQFVKTILFFEILSSTEWQMQTSNKSFMPNWYVDIGKEFKKKIAALKCYDSEMREYPHPRSYEGVETLAKYRGLCIGTIYAEAFSLGRNII